MARSETHSETRRTGFGQLSLVEHSLCPLDRKASLVENLQHQAEYRFSDANRKRRTATAKIFSPLGLSASDEIYLWGLLALTLSQPDDRSDLVATPHWCLKQLGIVNSRSGRGGEQYRMFRDALRRLSVTSYLCDAFYDPVRAEDREVGFHFLSYSLPTDPASSRAWRFSWDQTFFELAKHGASHLRFDLDLYRSLDPASRRLFLLAAKIFYRRATLPQFDLQHLAVEVLGFSTDIAKHDLRMKVIRCLKRLDAVGVVRDFSVERIGKSQYAVNARRGAYFDRDPVSGSRDRLLQPVQETLVGLGFHTSAARGLLRKYPSRLLEEWADITQAKIDRQGIGSFRRSPMAYLVDSVSKAHRGTRTPPDWWHELRREETKQTSLTVESRKLFSKIRSELFDGSSEVTAKNSDGISVAGDILKTIR